MLMLVSEVSQYLDIHVNTYIYSCIIVYIASYEFYRCLDANNMLPSHVAYCGGHAELNSYLSMVR